MKSRRLTNEECAVLLHVLSVPFNGVEELREQVALANATKSRGASFEIEVVDAAPRSSFRDRLVPVDAVVIDDEGSILGDILVWVSQGRLSGLEYTWITDQPPRSLPAPTSIRLSHQ
jgi:hypothetical protein